MSALRLGSVPHAAPPHAALPPLAAPRPSAPKGGALITTEHGLCAHIRRILRQRYQLWPWRILKNVAIIIFILSQAIIMIIAFACPPLARRLHAACPPLARRLPAVCPPLARRLPAAEVDIIYLSMGGHPISK